MAKVSTGDSRSLTGNSTEEMARELKLVVTSLKGLVSGDLTEERFAVLEYGSACTGESTDWLQRVVADLCVEFVTRFISHVEVHEEPAALACSLSFRSTREVTCSFNSNIVA
jgi:hypothetical protein